MRVAFEWGGCLFYGAGNCVGRHVRMQVLVGACSRAWVGVEAAWCMLHGGCVCGCCHRADSLLEPGLQLLKGCPHFTLNDDCFQFTCTVHCLCTACKKSSLGVDLASAPSMVPSFEHTTINSIRTFHGCAQVDRREPRGGHRDAQHPGGRGCRAARVLCNGVAAQGAVLRVHLR